MKVKVAKSAGVCMGVQRAMNMVLDAANSQQDQIYTYGPLIHNPQVIEFLEKKGVVVVQDSNSLSAGTVLIRAHGIPPLLRQELKSSPARISDATCPRVGSVQSTIKKHMKMGYTPIIVGEAGHPEVVGLMGYSYGRGRVINSLEEVDALPSLEKVVVVAQTTQDQVKYDSIVEKIKTRYSHVISFDTICESTRLRQEEVRQMAGEVDAMVVVGGRNSGNTRRLAEIAAGCMVKTFHIESEEELEPEQFSNTKVVGVSAGASTPDWTIRRVVEGLSQMGETRRFLPSTAIPNTIRFLYSSGIYTSLAALGLFMAAATLMGGEIAPLLVWAAALYIFSQQTTFNLINREQISFTSPRNEVFFTKYRTPLIITAVVACPVSLMLSHRLGALPMLILASAFALAVIQFWHIRSGMAKRRDGKVRKLKTLWGEGEIVFSLSWALVLAGAPAAAAEASLLPSLTAGALVFLAAFLRINLINLQNVQGDKMLGRLTLAVRLGEKKSEALNYWLAALLSSIPAAGAVARLFPPSAYLIAAVPACFLLLMKHRRADIFYSTNNFMVAVDSPLVIYMVPALLWYPIL